jgi:hypothetical protein
MLFKILFNISLPSTQGCSAVCSLQVLPPSSEQMYRVHHAYCLYRVHHAYCLHHLVYPLNLINLIIFWGRVHIMKGALYEVPHDFHHPKFSPSPLGLNNSLSTQFSNILCLRSSIRPADMHGTTYQLLGMAHIETRATQPTQGRAAQIFVIHTFEYVSAS